MHTAIFKTDYQQGPTVEQGNSAQCYVAARMGGQFEGEWIHVCMWLSRSAVLLKLLHC